MELWFDTGYQMQAWNYVCTASMLLACCLMVLPGVFEMFEGGSVLCALPRWVQIPIMGMGLAGFFYAWPRVGVTINFVIYVMVLPTIGAPAWAIVMGVGINVAAWLYAFWAISYTARRFSRDTT